MKCGAAFHLERRPRVMGEHKDRRVIRRLISPPAFPTFVRPRAAHRPEHIPPENIRADTSEALRRDIIVDAGLAAFIAVHPLPGARGKKPVKYSEPANPERILQILIWPRAVTIDRDREMDAKFGHKSPF